MELPWYSYYSTQENVNYLGGLSWHSQICISLEVSYNPQENDISLGSPKGNSWLPRIFHFLVVILCEHMYNSTIKASILQLFRLLVANVLRDAHF